MKSVVGKFSSSPPPPTLYFHMSNEFKWSTIMVAPKLFQKPHAFEKFHKSLTRFKSEFFYIVAKKEGNLSMSANKNL